MFDRLEQIETKYNELTHALASPEIVNDSARYQKTAKAHSEIASIVEKQRWKVEVLSSSESGVGGMKEVIALIEGKGAYSKLKYESGVHRVQRVPQTETQGRVHTSAITVAVLPEAEEVDIKIEAKDL